MLEILIADLRDTLPQESEKQIELVKKPLEKTLPVVVKFFLVALDRVAGLAAFGTENPQPPRQRLTIL